MSRLTAEQRAALQAEADVEIAAAQRHGLTLTRADFTIVDGDLFIDGTPPREWIEAVSGLREVTGPDGTVTLEEIG